MRVALALLLAATILAAFALESHPKASADTIHLANGSIIRGEAVQDPDREGMLKIRFSNGGIVYLRADEVRSVADDDRDAFRRTTEGGSIAPAAVRKPVRVSTKSGKLYYGNGVYIGEETPESNDETLVLRLRGGGELRIPRSNVASIDPVALDEAGVRPAIEGRVIATTHRAVLKNGRVVVGDLIPSAEDQPIALRVGGLGTLTIPREDVELLVRAAGEYVLPKPAVGDEPRDPPIPAPDADTLDALRKEIRREILHEILDQLLGEKLDTKLDAVIREELSLVTPVVEKVTESVSGEEILEIQYHVRELGRQRSTNRVRAERRLIAIGPSAVPYLAPAAAHPFGLTRRAAQRIVKAVGDTRGVPLAIDALTDSDEHVRRLAYETLGALFPSDIAYRPTASERSQARAQDLYRKRWVEMQRERLQDALAAGVRTLLNE